MRIKIGAENPVVDTDVDLEEILEVGAGVDVGVGAGS